MNTSKKIFVVLAVLFFALMVYLGYDISSKTTFPGSKSQLKERINREIIQKDSTKEILKDSISSDN